ncbi:hypothetical protein C3L33_12022, partial [Rhododendron williamsianum]
MASDSRLAASVLVKDCKGVFEGLNSLVDVGGGTGTVAKSVADAFPDRVGVHRAIPSADAVLLK